MWRDAGIKPTEHAMTKPPADAVIVLAQQPDDGPGASLGAPLFAERLVSAMRAKGWNQAETARQVTARLPAGQKFTAANLSHYIHGRSAPRRAIRQILVRLLELDAEPRRAPGAAAGMGLSSNIHVEDLHDGTVRLIVNDRVPWPTAIRVLRALLLSEEAPVGRDDEPG
jgi:hypothetical protein